MTLRGMRPVAWTIVTAAVLGAQPIDRTKQPQATESHPYKLPTAFAGRLPNGLTVLLVEDPRVPLVTVHLVFSCGNRRDPKQLPGLASVVADMLTQGTSHRNFIQIAEALDGLGGAIDASSGADHLALNGSIDARNLPSMIDVMADVARNAEFPEIDLRLELQNRKQTLGRQHSQPAFVANEAFRAALFGDHPYAHIGPTAASLDSIARKALVDYRDTWMVPNNAFLIVVGRLPPNPEMMKLITGGFASWNSKTLPEVTRAPLPAPSSARRLILIDRPGSVQVDVRIGKLAATQRDPGYFAELAGSTIVGGVPMGRMFIDLREKLGFAYDVRTEHVAFDEAGVLSATTQVRNEVAGEAIQAMLDHLDRMAATPVAEWELVNAKSQAVGSFLLRLEPQAGLADELMIERVQNLGPSYLGEWRPRFESVSVADVQAAAKKYMATGNAVIVVVGDAAKILPSLEKIGKFEVVKSFP